VAARVNSASSVRPSAAALEDASSCASSRGCVLREGESWELEPDIAPPSFLREPRAYRHPAGFLVTNAQECDNEREPCGVSPAARLVSLPTSLPL
jgi:hypothetical protein